jgi:hypothetical protein
LFVGDSTWLKYTIGVTFLSYTLVHDGRDDMVMTLFMILDDCGTWFMVEAYHEGYDTCLWHMVGMLVEAYD